MLAVFLLILFFIFFDLFYIDCPKIQKLCYGVILLYLWLQRFRNVKLE